MVDIILFMFYISLRILMDHKMYLAPAEYHSFPVSLQNFYKQSKSWVHF